VTILFNATVVGSLHLVVDWLQAVGVLDGGVLSARICGTNVSCSMFTFNTLQRGMIYACNMFV
jgi:hypothetical protein